MKRADGSWPATSNCSWGGRSEGPPAGERLPEAGRRREAQRLPAAGKLLSLRNLPAAVQAEIVAIAQDHMSGAAALGVRGAHALQLLARSSVAESLPRFREVVVEATRALIAAQPTMAPMVSLSNRALRAVESSADLDAARGALEEASLDFLARQSAATDKIARLTVTLLPDPAVVLTHSSSDAVLSALLLAHRDRIRISVICTESRPQMEGRTLATRLAAKGIAVRLVVDAMGPALAGDTDLLLVGADAVSQEGLINKVGTYALALAASRAGTPFYVLCETAKFLPAEYPIRVPDQDPAEVWSKIPPRVRITNRYFDLTPWDLIRGVITEEGTLSPEQVQEAVSAQPFHPELG